MAAVQEQVDRQADVVKVMGLRTRMLAGPIMDSWSASPADVLRELGTAELAAGQPNAVAEWLAAAAAEAHDFDSRLSIVLMRRHALVLADRLAEAASVVDAIGASPDGRGYADWLEVLRLALASSISR